MIDKISKIYPLAGCVIAALAICLAGYVFFGDEFPLVLVQYINPALK